MRYATFSLPTDTRTRLGVVRDHTLIDVHALLSADGLPRTLAELISQGRDGWDRLARLINQALGATLPASAIHRGDAVRWHAPTGRPTKNVVCLGLNYISHAKESAQARGREFKIPEALVFFTKVPTSVTGPTDPIPWDALVTAQLDYEAELGVVIGIPGR